ncbi:MAG: V-type ATPase subunit [Nitrospiraceae bacterium]|nr:V-type ATPase subunit [Nitrospiraceae bacterium]
MGITDREERTGLRGPRGLLLQPRTEGYPVAYVLTRLRGRRSRLIREWKALIYDNEPAEYLASSRYDGFIRERTADGIWASLAREHRWVFTRSDEEVRSILAPYFLYAELRTIVIIIRSLSGGGGTQPGTILENSLLNQEIQAALKRDDAALVVKGLERNFSRWSAVFTGLSRIYGDGGIRELERELVSRTFSAILSGDLHVLVRQLFRRIIDSRNIIALFKSLRLENGTLPVFTKGGIIAPERLRTIHDRGDLAAVATLVRQASGIAISDPDPTKVEVSLYRGITRFLRQEGRDPLGIGVFVDYLWRCSLEVMNLSVVLAGKELEREAVVAEMVS